MTDMRKKLEKFSAAKRKKMAIQDFEDIQQVALTVRKLCDEILEMKSLDNDMPYINKIRHFGSELVNKGYTVSAARDGIYEKLKLYNF